MSFFQNKCLPLIKRPWLASLSLVCLFCLQAVAAYILDMAVCNFCGKSNLYLKLFSHFLTHQQRQPCQNWLPQGRAGIIPAQLYLRGLTSPRPLAIAVQNSERAHASRRDSRAGMDSPAHHISAGRCKLSPRPGEDTGLRGC